MVARDEGWEVEGGIEEVGVGYSVSRWVLDILFRGMRWKHHAMGKDDAGQKEWDSEP